MPAGHPHGGEWTKGDAVASYKDPLILSDAPDPTWEPGARYATGPRNRGGSGAPILINGQWFELTPGEAARYEVALGQWQYFTTLVRRVDPNWKPTPGWYRSDPEGKTTELETEAQEAQDRLVEVTGVGAKPPPQRGQHYVSRKVFENKPLREDTRRVFEDAASGPLSDPTVNLYSKPHREYNRAVDEAFENFLAERGIESKNMTPAQARDFLHGVLRSNDPRIHDFNMRIFEQRYLHRKSIFGTEEPDDD